MFYKEVLYKIDLYISKNHFSALHSYAEHARVQNTPVPPNLHLLCIYTYIKHTFSNLMIKRQE